jgi:CheY-like chemotaxis protein
MTTQPKKILLVDDCKVSLLAQELMLSGPHLEILKATHGVEALCRAVADLPDLILLDIRMPDVDGLEVLRALRSEELTRDIPVLLVTACGDLETRGEATRRGCDDYITKPVDVRELKAKVKRHLAA